MLDAGSLKKLQGVHPDLVAVVTRASENGARFIVTSGVRTLKEQEKLFAKGATKTMKSRHLTGHAVDLAPLLDKKVRWDWPLFYLLADEMFKAAKELNIQIEWGGHWRTFKDGPHFQLPWKSYPK